MNSSVTPDRPWLDLAYQLTGIVIALVPVLLALHLLRRDDPAEPHTMGFDLRRPWQDLWRGVLLSAAIGLPGLALYAAAKALDLNTTIAAANLAGAWWTIPVLLLAAAQNAVLEEVVMVGYLFTGGARSAGEVADHPTSALIRGSYHLYQGFGGFVGNLVMGIIFGWFYSARNGSCHSSSRTPSSTSWPSSATPCSRAASAGSEPSLHRPTGHRRDTLPAPDRPNRSVPGDQVAVGPAAFWAAGPTCTGTSVTGAPGLHQVGVQRRDDVLRDAPWGRPRALADVGAAAEALGVVLVDHRDDARRRAPAGPAAAGRGGRPWRR